MENNIEAIGDTRFYQDSTPMNYTKLYQIEEAIDAILNKKYGKDVRYALAVALRRLYVDATTNGNANLEVSQAREKYTTLSERLNHSDQNLSMLLSKILTQSEQLESIIANAGDGTVPSELIGVRTLSNGKTFMTAGESVRSIDERISDMPKAIKNIITNVHTGKYWSNRTIGQDGTALNSNTDYTAYTVSVEPGSIISSNIEMIGAFSHFLDSSKKAISTLDGTKQSNFVYRVPSNAQWLHVTINKPTATLVVVNHPSLAVGKSYTDCLPGTVLGYEVDGVYLSKSDFATLANVSNLPKILKNEVTQVFEKTYWSNRNIGQDGTVRGSNNEYTSYIVKVTPNTKISSNVSLPSPFTHFLNAGKQNLALLDSYVDSNQDGYVYNVPSDAEWLYVTRNKKELELVVIEGAKDIRNLTYSQYPAGTFYGFEINGNVHPFVENTDSVEYIDLLVGTDKSYQNIKQALNAVVNSGPNRIYTIILDDGTYEFSMLGDRLPDYVHIRSASGEPTKCIIRGDVPDNADDNTITQTSTINVSKNNNFEGITFTGRNCRYVIHDESSGVDRNWKRMVKNCRFIHYGNQGAREYRNKNGGDVSKVWQVTRAWGEGASEGSYSQYDNCYFESPVQPWYIHEPNAIDSTKPYHRVHNNCTFISTAVEYGGFGGGINIDNTHDRGGAVHMIDFNNCNFSNCPIQVNGQYPIKVRISGGNETFINAEYPINYPETDFTVKRYYQSDVTLTGGEVLAASSAGFNYVELATPHTPQQLIAGIYIGMSAKKGDSIRVLAPTLFASKLLGAFGSPMYVGSDGKLTLTQGSIPVGLYMSGKDKLYKN